MESAYFRSIWISDVHLGFKDCKADYLDDFLNSVRCDTLYLIGDLFDFWQAERGWRWTCSHTRVVRTLLTKRAQGTRIIYVPGNHDEIARNYSGLSFGGVEVARDAIHHTADDRRFLVAHGDEFDAVIPRRLPDWFCHGAYDLLLFASRCLNRVRQCLGLPFWSLATHLKLRIPGAVKHIKRFEHAAANEAKRRGLDGVICGHIHKAAISSINGVLYCNDGDWVESCTAMVEHDDGRFEIIYAAEETRVLIGESRQRPDKQPLPSPAA